jgi:hypothetical protein
MNRFGKVIYSIFLLSLFSPGFAQDYYGLQRESWLKKAAANTPELIVTEKKPQSIVRFIKNASAFQGWETKQVSSVDVLYNTSFKSQREVIVDFGEHLTGYFSMNVRVLKGIPDAPLRFRCTFGEVPAELATPFDPYNSGMSRAWLQDEVVTVMDVPAAVSIPRRVAFRYVKIELLGSSSWYDFSLDHLVCRAQTSAYNQPEVLPENVQKIYKDIDRVGLNTLKECMQTVYEDGVKRDQRLWLGDLYLESLANNYSYKQFDITRR